MIGEVVDTLPFVEVNLVELMVNPAAGDDKQWGCPISPSGATQTSTERACLDENHTER